MILGGALCCALLAAGCGTEMTEDPEIVTDGDQVSIDSGTSEGPAAGDPSEDAGEDPKWSVLRSALTGFQYDGTNPYGSNGCYKDKLQAFTVAMYSKGRYAATLYLWYSPRCKTTWASITTLGCHRGTDWGGYYDCGRAEVLRKGPKKAIYKCETDPGEDSCHTPQVYNGSAQAAYGQGFLIDPDGNIIVPGKMTHDL